MGEMSKRVLSTLLISGAQLPEKAIGSADLATMLGIEESSLEAEIEELVRGGYVVSSQRNGVPNVYLTTTGIIAASSTYS
jgi:hypothetical protein